MHSDLWVKEVIDENFAASFRVERTLFSAKGPFQTVDIVETKGHGRMLLNDGMVMLSERDEHVYHEMMAHVPLMVHPNPKRVLVIGGGDGGTAREVLRHPQIEKCAMVEIDQLVVDACKEHIPQTASVFGHPKLELVIGDGVDYVAQYKKGQGQKFDVILVDSTDPVGPAQPLFGPEFYQNIYDCLTDDGIVVSQGESPYYHQAMQRTLIKIIWEKFPVATLLNFHNMTYPGGLWSFSFGSKKYHPERDFRPSGLATIKGGFRYYNENVHRACFALPNFQLENVGQFIKI